MHMDFSVVRTAFQADNAGVALSPDTPCDEGHPAFSVTLPGRWIGKTPRPTAPGPITVLLARATATHMTGAFLAFLAATEGPEAVDAFMDEARAACDNMAPSISQLYAQDRGCCEAAYRTAGREHTCKTAQR